MDEQATVDFIASQWAKVIEDLEQASTRLSNAAYFLKHGDFFVHGEPVTDKHRLEAAANYVYAARSFLREPDLGDLIKRLDAACESAA